MLTSGNIISIRDFPPTSRYILKNIFGSTKTNSPREGMKEVITNLRSLFYTKMSIDAKQEETIKLNEYLMMEQEKIIEARIKFEEDCDRFTKYVKDVDHQTNLAHKASEEAVRKRMGLADELDRLQVEIAQNERDWIKADDNVKQYLGSKNFVE
jgi:hypothetical protein